MSLVSWIGERRSTDDAAVMHAIANSPSIILDCANCADPHRYHGVFPAEAFTNVHTIQTDLLYTFRDLLFTLPKHCQELNTSTVIITSFERLFTYHNDEENADIHQHVWELLKKLGNALDITVAVDAQGSQTALARKFSHRTGKPMGHTVMSQRQVIEALTAELNSYARALNEEDRKLFERAMKLPLKHLGSISYASSLHAWAFFLLSAIVEQQRKLEKKMWVMDAWRNSNTLSFWMKTSNGEEKRTIPYNVRIYVKECTAARNALNQLNLPFTKKTKQTFDKQLSVLEVPIPQLNRFEKTIHAFERLTRHRVPLYDADITPEQRFFHEKNLYSGCPVNKDLSPRQGGSPVLKTAHISVSFSHNTVQRIECNDKEFLGTEQSLLTNFTQHFISINPDVIVMDKAFSVLPRLQKRLEQHRIVCPWHRWDPVPLRYRGGKTFFSYGKVSYRDFAIRLHGRFLVSTQTPIGRTCDPDAILELCSLSGWQFQQLASRSHGATFQGALMRELLRDNKIIAYKEKPLPQPMSMTDLVKADRAGHTLDAHIGFHKDVAEIDFSSMFPNLMVQKNISAEKVGSGTQAPGVPVRIDESKEGYIPKALRPFIERRMHYKNNPSTINRRRSAGLKGVLVSANGYLRFREFKLGLATTHVALCAHARELLLDTMKEAEQRGFQVIHGIIDSLYIKKPGITEKEVLDLCNHISERSGIPMSFEGIFKWMVFLPSVNDVERPVPTRFYGAFRSGGIKVRGVETRQRKPPLVVRRFQEAAIHVLSERDTELDVRDCIPSLFRAAKRIIHLLPNLNPDLLAFTIDISKTNYKHDIPQRRVVRALQKKGVEVQPGMTVQYLLAYSAGASLLEDFNGIPDSRAYREEFVRCLHSILLPFNFSRHDVRNALLPGAQTSLLSYNQHSIHSEVVLEILERAVHA